MKKVLKHKFPTVDLTDFDGFSRKLRVAFRLRKAKVETERQRVINSGRY